MTLYPADYETLTSVRLDKAIGTTKTSDDAMLRRFIRQSSRLWDLWTTRTFVPYVATKEFGVSHISGGRLNLRDDLLSLTTLTNADSAVIVSNSYKLRPYNSYPKNSVDLTTIGGAGWSFPYLDSLIQIEGIWGFHEDYARAWGDSLDTVKNNPLTSSATTITVNDSAGYDDRYMARFEVGDYLLIESEQAQIVAIPSSATLTVLRGVNGTTAAAHALNTPIYVYRQTEDVRFAVREIVKWMYERRDTVNKGVQLTQDLGIIIQTDLPEIKALAEHYAVDNSSGLILAV